MSPITPGPTGTRRSSHVSPPPPHSSSCAISRPSRRSSSASTPPARARPGRGPTLRPGPERRRSEPAGTPSDMTLRVIPGGRGDAVPPGLLVVGAAEVVTVGGGLRAGGSQNEVARLSAADAGGPDAPSAPVVAAWE